MSQETRTVRYWCHICNAEVPIYMAPEMTCQYCNEQFIEEVQTEDDPREFLNGVEDNDEQDRSDLLPFLYSPNRLENSSNTSEIGDDLFQYFTPTRRTTTRTRNIALETDETTPTRSNSPPLSTVIQTMLTSIMGPEHAETTTEHRTGENNSSISRQTLYFGNMVDGNIRFQLMPGSMPRSDSTNNSENRENAETDTTNTTNERFNSIASILRLLSTFTGSYDDEIAGNPDDYVFSQTALDNIISQLMEQTGGTSAPPPAPENVIDSLVKRPLNDKEKSKEADCAVCKDEFLFQEQVVELPCEHIFHNECIKPWLKLNSTCPVCRHSVIPDESHHSVIPDEPSVESHSNQSNLQTFHLFGSPPRREEVSMPAAWPSNSSQESSGNQHSSSNDSNK